MVGRDFMVWLSLSFGGFRSVFKFLFAAPVAAFRNGGVGAMEFLPAAETKKLKIAALA